RGGKSGEHAHQGPRREKLPDVTGQAHDGGENGDRATGTQQRYFAPVPIGNSAPDGGGEGGDERSRSGDRAAPDIDTLDRRHTKARQHERHDGTEKAE